MHQGAELFYRCRFQTAPTSDVDDPLWLIIRHIRTWMCKKHPTLTWDSRQWTSNIKFGGSLRASRGDVRIAAKICAADDGTGDLSWACSIDEQADTGNDPKTSAPYASQTWTTEIGYRQHGADRRGEVSILLSYCNKPRFIGRQSPPPQPSIPRIVTLITHDRRLRCNVSAMPIDSMVIGIEADRSDASGALTATSPHVFWDRVTDPGREYPIVYVGVDRSWHRTVDLRKLGRALYPNALICYPTDADAEEQLKALRPERLYCEWYGVSVFFPSAGIRHVSSEGASADGGWRERSIVRAHGLSWPMMESIRSEERERGQMRAWWGDDMPDPIIVLLRRALAQDVTFGDGDGFVTMEKVDRDLERKRARIRIEQAKTQLDAAMRDVRASQERLDAMRAEHDRRHRQIEDEEAARVRRAQERQAVYDEQTSRIDALGDELTDARERIASLKRRVEGAESEASEAMQMAVDADAARADAMRQLSEESSRRFELEQQVNALRGNLQAMQATQPAQGGGRFDRLVTMDLPDRIASASKRDYGRLDEELVKDFAACCEDRIYVAPGALKGCVTRPALVWQGMLCMCTAVYDVYASDHGSGSPDVRFRQMPDVPPQFELALAEGRNTNRNKRLRRLRRLEYRGRTLDITPHLKVGRGWDSEDTLRIYFAWDDVDGRIVIGHIGTHLENDTSINGKR